MNYPTVKEQGLLRSVLRHAADVADTIEHANCSGWVVDSTELLEYVLRETDKLNDAVLALVTEHTVE